MRKDDEERRSQLSRLFKAGISQCPSPADIIAYVEGEKVDPGVEHHLRHCSFCRAEMEDIKSELGSLSLSPKRLRDSAYGFIKRFYPHELDLFEIAWRVFHDILPEDFHQEAVSGALGIVGDETADLKTPKVIVLLNAMTNRSVASLSDQEAGEVVAGLAQEVGCPQNLARQLHEYLLGQ